MYYFFRLWAFCELAFLALAEVFSGFVFHSFLDFDLCAGFRTDLLRIFFGAAFFCGFSGGFLLPPGV